MKAPRGENAQEPEIKWNWFPPSTPILLRYRSSPLRRDYSTFNRAAAASAVLPPLLPLPLPKRIRAAMNMISIVLEKAAVANWLPSVFRGKNAIDRPKNLFFEWLTLIAARVQLTRGWRKGGCRYSYVISFSAIPRKGTTAATARTCLERLLG